MDRILEFHLLDPDGGIVPLSIVFTHVLADASAQLLNDAQGRIVGNRQICRFPPENISVRYFECRKEVALTESPISSHYAPTWCSPRWNSGPRFLVHRLGGM
jgi:hypothetical protein